LEEDGYKREDIACCINGYEYEGDTADCAVDVDVVVMAKDAGGEEDG